MNFNQLPLELITKIISFVPDLYYFYILNLVHPTWYQIISRIYSKNQMIQKCQQFDMGSLIRPYLHFIKFLIMENFETNDVLDIMFMDLFFKDCMKIYKVLMEERKKKV